jgi:hypothetical protein
MTNSKAFWFLAGVGAVFAYHHFAKPLPGGKAS